MSGNQQKLGLGALGLVALLLIGAVIYFTGRTGNAVSTEPGLQAALTSSLERSENNRWQAIYRARAFTPIWLTPHGPSKDARAVMELLAQAENHGLPSARYAFAPPPADDSSDETLAAFDIGLTRAAFLYAHDLEFGLFTPARLFGDVSLPARRDNSLTNFEVATGRANVAEYLQGLEPRAGEYGALKAALIRYRGLAGHPWQSVSAGDQAGLASRLAAEGYLEASAGQQTSREALTDALKSYQAANGMDADGKLDDRTLAMLNVPPATRAQQIAANMERWRWLPRDVGDRYIIVNAASASLALVENGATVLTSRVVVGAPDKPTPILGAQAVAVTINPIWHVPKSIIVNEIEPKLEDDPNYLESKDMERTSDGDIIQHAGPQNALGTMKFEMPNGFNVYLHDTPSKRAFLSDDRAQSHGCVRVEKIGELVQRVLHTDDIARKVGSGQTLRELINPAVPVWIQYWTAVPTQNGGIGFRVDTYGRDAIMIKALEGSSRSRLASAK